MTDHDRPTVTGPFADILAGLDAAVARRGEWEYTASATRALAALRGQDDAEALAVLTPRLTELADRFDLGPRDSHVLAVAALAELHPAAHLILGLLSGDDHAARPSAALALELTGTSLVSAAARRRLSGLGPLRRHGLVELIGDDVLLSRRLKVTDRVVAYLAGDDTPDAQVAALLAPALPVDVEGTAALAGVLQGGAPLIWVQTGPGTAGTALAVAACRELDVVCLVADLDRVLAPPVPGSREAAAPPPDPDRVRGLVRALTLEAGLVGALLVVAGAQHAGPAMDLLWEASVPVIAVGPGGWDRRWGADLPPVLQAPRLTTAQREVEWRAALAGTAPPREVTALRLTPEEIHVVGRAVRQHAALSGGEVTATDVTRTARRLGRGAGAVQAPGRSATLDDLVLPDATRSEVQRLINWARYRDDVLALGQVQGTGGKGGGITALFSGSPGTGKTLAAHVVADAVGMELYQVDLSAIVDKYIGETEKNLERVFAEAEALNCVLFFDEADSLFGARSAVNDSRDRYANQEVAYLLQRMESFDGITILATNLRGNLDQAFARRLHFMIHFPDPDAPTRRRLWERHLDHLPELDAADPVDLDVLADHLELAGGDIRNVVLAATYEAVADTRPVAMADLRLAAAREYTKLGRRLPSGDWLEGLTGAAPASGRTS